MKPVHKGLLIASLIVASTIAITWVGGILYWELRVRATLRSWEKAAKPVPSFIRDDYGLKEADSNVLVTAGCRALPPMVSALNASNNRRFQEGLMFRIVRMLAGPEQPEGHELDAWHDRLERWSLTADVRELQHQDRLAVFNRWWAEHGREYHRTWRFWSAWCPGD